MTPVKFELSRYTNCTGAARVKIKTVTDKTHLLLMCTKQRRHKLNNEVVLRADNHVVSILADQSIYNIEALVNLATSFRVIRAAVTR